MASRAKRKHSRQQAKARQKAASFEAQSRQNTHGLAGGGFGGTFGPPQDYGLLPPGMTPANGNTGVAVAQPAPQPLPQYAESPWLAGVRAMIKSQGDALEANRDYDVRRVGFKSGVGVGADPNYRFSQMKLLDRAFGRTMTGLETDMASAGLLFSGAKHRADADATFDRDKGSDSIGQGALDATTAINRGATDAQNQLAMQGATAEGQDRDRWLDTIRAMGVSQ